MVDLKMNLRRIFYPVGQGLFCSEEFNVEGETNPVNVVYDCGCFEPSREVRIDYSMRRTLSDYIEEAFPNKAMIHAVFISHLHYDHISGLNMLLRHRNVKYVFLPQLSPALLLESALYSKFYASDVEFQETVSLMQSLSENNERIRETRVVQILPISSEDDNNTEYSEIDILSNNSYSGSNLKKCRIRLGCFWEYIPFNYYANSTKAEQLLEALQSIDELKGCFIGNRVNFISLASALQDKSVLAKCKKIYKQIFAHENEYSMPVYSGPVNLINREYDCYNFECDRSYWEGCCYRRYQSYGGCLYTGDFPASDSNFYNAMKQFYSMIGVWHKISVVQVPHHGSYNGHNVDLYMHLRRAVISVGIRNKYHHPDYEVIRDIKEISYSCPHIITEADDRYQEIIQYRIN